MHLAKPDDEDACLLVEEENEKALLKFLVVAENNHLEDLRFTMYKVQFEYLATRVGVLKRSPQPPNLSIRNSEIVIRNFDKLSTTIFNRAKEKNACRTRHAF